MADYSVTIARSARKELEALERTLFERILVAISGLAAQPHPPGCKKLQGRADLWRIRIGDYRLVYSVDHSAKVVDVVIIRHRRDVYR